MKVLILPSTKPVTIIYNILDEKSAIGMQQMEKGGLGIGPKKCMAGAGMSLPEAVNSIGPNIPNWSMKVRKLIDPVAVCDPKMKGF